MISDVDLSHEIIASDVDCKVTEEPFMRSERSVDVVLSDMSAPWHPTSGFWKRSLSDPYNRMMNTSGMSFRDHAGSMVSFLFRVNSQFPGT
jgi:21S rRNA (uridine2791-2'-O)-methyltransferase